MRVAKVQAPRKFHRWLVPALFEWAIIILLFATGIFASHWLAWALIVFLLGSRQHALGVLGHDAAHHAASENRVVNDVSAEILCFWPIGSGMHEYRRFHLAHHKCFNTALDPELLFKNDWSRKQWALPMTRARIVGYFALDLLGFGLHEIAKAYWLMGKSTFWSWVGPLLWWGVVGGLLWHQGLGYIAAIWFLALGTSFWGFFRLRTWTEHVGSDSTHRVRANWWQRFLITPYCSWAHYEHHAYPSVPFWRRHELRPADAQTVSMGELFRSFGTRGPAYSPTRARPP